MKIETVDIAKPICSVGDGIVFSSYNPRNHDKAFKGIKKNTLYTVFSVDENDGTNFTIVDELGKLYWLNHKDKGVYFDVVYSAKGLTDTPVFSTVKLILETQEELDYLASAMLDAHHCLEKKFNLDMSNYYEVLGQLVGSASEDLP